MTNTELQALREATIYPNNTRQISAEKLNAVLDELINKAGGWIFYQNSSSTPQTIPAETERQLSNDGLGAATLTTHKPHFVQNGLFQNSTIDLGELPTGAIVHGRFSANLTTLFNNTEVKLVAKFRNSSGQIIATYPFADVEFKTQGSHTITEIGMFFVGNGFVNGTIEFYAEGNVEFQILWTDLILDIR